MGYVPKISVIIPVYNDEEFIEQALSSVLSQTMQDIEIICVDDGSTDGTTEILKAFAQGDSRFVLIHHHVNKGTLIARKTGVKAATGEYIMFLDADDSIMPECCETAYDLICKNKVDILCFSIEVMNYFEDGSFERKEMFPHAEIIGNVIEHPLALLTASNREYVTLLWGKIYNSRLVKQAHEAIDDIYAIYGEDLYETFYIFLYAKSILGYKTKPLLTYNQGRGIISDAALDIDKFRIICGMGELSRRIQLFLDREGIWENNQIYWRNSSLRMVMDCLLELYRLREEDYPEAREVLLNAWGENIPWSEVAWLLAVEHSVIKGWLPKLEKGRQWLEAQVEFKDKRIDELEDWSEKNEKAKEWFERQIAFKDDRIKELESWNMELEKAKEWYLDQIKVKDAKISELLSQSEAKKGSKFFIEKFRNR